MTEQVNFGSFWDFPPQWRSISADEFASKMVRKNIKHQEYRQMRNAGQYEPATIGRLFFFEDDTGIAVVSRSVRKSTGFGYEEHAEFFAFGCNHIYQDIEWDQDRFGPQMSCDHASKCVNCGHEFIYNSGD